MTREEAIAILDGFKHNPLFNEQHSEALDMAISALSDNKGEWIHDNSHWKYRFNCSKCGYKLFEAKTNYCPNCGARMKGGE